MLHPTLLTSTDTAMHLPTVPLSTGIVTPLPHLLLVMLTNTATVMPHQMLASTGMEMQLLTLQVTAAPFLQIPASTGDASVQHEGAP